MDESLQELENELKGLQPRRPSALLRARIEREMAEPAPAANRRYTTATSLRSWKWFSWQSAAAAAAGVMLAVSIGVWRGRSQGGEAATVEGATFAQATPDRSEKYVPVSATSVLYDLKDEGAVTLENEQTARQARYRYVDTYTWRNPATNASVKFSVPRDEVRVVPANFN